MFQSRTSYFSFSSLGLSWNCCFCRGSTYEVILGDYINIDVETTIYFYFSIKISRTQDEFAKCHVMAIPSKICTMPMAFGFQKNSPYLPIFNFHIKKMIEKGTFDKFYQQFLPQPQVCPESAGKPLGFTSTLTGFLAYIAGIILGLIILIFEYQIDKIQGNPFYRQKNINEAEKKRIKLEVQSNIMENFHSIQSETENLIQKMNTTDENSIVLRFYLELNSLKRNFISNVLSDKYNIATKTILTPLQADK